MQSGGIAMTIPANEAADALAAAEAAAGRSAAAHGYRAASGHLLVWGAVWILANLTCQVSLQFGRNAWMALAIAGIVGSALVGRRQGADRMGGGWRRSLVIAAALILFGMSVQMIAPPLSFAQTDALACLAVGAVYMAMGANVGLRLSAVGAAVMVATVAGWMLAPNYFFAWIAAAGGGALILGGFWFRKV
jgi:hypothetical protein